MHIKIDYREINLLRFFQKSNLQYTVVNLSLGDIIICDSNEKELLIIERKTLTDLSASITDGRYKEQSFRLNNCSCHNHNIIYLIEGNLETYSGKMPLKTLQSAIFTLLYYKGFSVYQTKTTAESADCILHWFDKISRSKEKNGFYSTNKGFENILCAKTQETYCDVIKKTKKSNVTIENICQIMLSQIPSVSSATAKIISDKYTKIKKLCDAIHSDPTCLNDLKLKTKKGKERRISKTAIKNIILFLSES